MSEPSLFTFDPNEPYNDLPSLPPKADIETLPILRKVADARAALAELKGRAQIIPNPYMLLNTIVLQEARASSEIENVVTTNDALYKALSLPEDVTDASTKEVLRYQEALIKGHKILKTNFSINTKLFIEIVKTIKTDIFNIRTPEQGTIIIGNPLTGKRIYTPPEGEKIISDKLKNLETYLNNNKNIDPLIKMAIGHYQFEAIHPFNDGNGRTGRIINIL